MANFFESEKFKHYLPWIIGGGFGIVIIWYYFSKPSASAQTSTGFSAAAAQAANQASLQAAQIALEQQKEADAANNATATLNAQIAAANQQRDIDMITAAGTSISGTITAQDQRPAMAINKATEGHQTALTGAAAVAASAHIAPPVALD